MFKNNAKFKIYIVSIFLLLMVSQIVSLKVEAKNSDFVIKNGVLIKYNGDSKKVNIPKNVTAIGRNAFDKADITEVILPNSVRKIGEGAFASTNINIIDIPSSVTVIDDYAFAYCKQLKKILIHNKNITIMSNVFEESFWLNTQKKNYVIINGNLLKYNGNDPVIKIPESVRVICGGAFDELEYLEVVIIPSNVEIIGNEAFQSQEYLRKVVMSDSVEEIGKNAFFLCKSLIDIELSENLKSIGELAFFNTPLEKDIIPKNVKNIGYRAFGYNFLMYSDIASGVNRIFMNGNTYVNPSKSSSKVTIPNGYNIIGNGAFKDNKKIIEIVIPEGVVLIEADAFKNCSNLQKVTLPDSLRYMENSVFQGCKKLKSVTIPKKVSFMGDNVFSNCTSLESVKILGTINCIMIYTFENCYNLKKVILPQSITSLGNNSFYNCKSLESIKIPSNVEVIGDYCFAGCVSLKDVDLPKKINQIGQNAFYQCKNLNRIVIPEGVVNLKPYCFSGCENLFSVSLPSSLKSIGYSSFESCKKLSVINIPVKVMLISPRAFERCENLNNILLPKDLLSLGFSAFEDCTNLETINIPKNIREIEWGTFARCQNLREVVMTDHIERIEDEAFSNCSNLYKIDFPANLRYIGKNTFFNCSSLLLNELPNCVIGRNAFTGSGYYKNIWFNQYFSNLPIFEGGIINSIGFINNCDSSFNGSEFDFSIEIDDVSSQTINDYINKIEKKGYSVDINEDSACTYYSLYWDSMNTGQITYYRIQNEIIIRYYDMKKVWENINELSLMIENMPIYHGKVTYISNHLRDNIQMTLSNVSIETCLNDLSNSGYKINDKNSELNTYTAFNDNYDKVIIEIVNERENDGYHLEIEFLESFY